MKRIAIVAMILSAAGCTQFHFPSVLQHFHDATRAKALAIAGPRADPQAFGIATNAKTRLIAAYTALQRCETLRRYRDVLEPCDVIQVNEHSYEPGAALMRRLNAQAARDPALVWRVEGSRGRAYLAGSIHMLPRSQRPWPPAYDVAFEMSNALVVEVNNDDISPTAVRKLMARHARLPNQRRLEHVLTSDTIRRIRDMPEYRGQRWQYVRYFKPHYLLSEMNQSIYAERGLFPGSGLESEYLRRARQLSMPIHQLEDFSDGVVRYYETPLAEQAANLNQRVNTASPAHAIDPIMEAWWLADLDALQQIVSGRAGAADPRNSQMADRIDDLLTSAPALTYFILIGAGHLAGEDGLLQRLKNKHFSLTQLDRSGATWQGRRRMTVDVGR